MSGGLTQLVAYGAQDIPLTASPEITFFKKKHKRHTNFSVESIEQTLQGSVDFGKKVNCEIIRNGDLVHKCYLQATIPDVTLTEVGSAGADDWTFNWVSELGHFLISEVSVEIGGQRIDKHFGTWLSIWSSLTLPTGQKAGYLSMIGDDIGQAVSSDPADTVSADVTLAGKTIYVPLQFWFCRHVSLALPLIALQYHQVRMTLTLAPVTELYELTVTVGATPTFPKPSLGSTSLYVDYIFLDTKERQSFANHSHEYLVEQLQHTGAESLIGTNTSLRLNFNHPVKELVWVVQDDNRTGTNFTDADDGTGENPVASASLKFNGQERFSAREGTYFNKVQPYQHHTNIPAEGVNVYSFALRPEEHQPSGSANFSRLDNVTLSMTLTSAASGGSNPLARVYAVNYNLLRIKSGMGGLAYSN